MALPSLLLSHIVISPNEADTMAGAMRGTKMSMILRNGMVLMAILEMETIHQNRAIGMI